MDAVLVLVVEIGLFDVCDTALKVLPEVEDASAAEVGELYLLREVLAHLVGRVDFVHVLEGYLRVGVLDLLHYLTVPPYLKVSLVDIDDDVEIVG